MVPLILDGAFGTMVQALHLDPSNFAIDGVPTPGCNDALCLSRPDVVAEIHRKYLEAGADIISTNSFNATAVDRDGLTGCAYRIGLAAAKIARAEADKYGKLVAGSMGPTNHSLSISPDVNDPARRDVSWQEMTDAYSQLARGLIEGGADLILIETVYDTLNAKAAIKAVREISADIPVIISCTVSDASGRILSGQTIEAFAASVAHARPAALGLNCGQGAKHLLPFARRMAACSPSGVSAHPNAGLPNLDGGYDETPEMFAADMTPYLREGLLNIAGGCCGTTPAHIAALRQAAGPAVENPKEVLRQLADDQRQSPALLLAGLEPLAITPEANFCNIGERCNVAGSAKFARLIREEAYEEALQIARDQVAAGAQVIDVCMDDAMISAPEAMSRFLRLIASEPEIARVPLMIDSSSWQALEAGMQCAQGKSIVNSISLKEGEEKFIARAKQIQAYGAAAVVMLFDENGQADTFERKIQVAQRAYNLLIANGFPQADIIFDPNVLAVATGMPEHDRYALDFIEATRWIKANLPGARVSGGVSNLSFAFRGNNLVRKAMHAAFLYHAINAGLDMAIVNPQMVLPYCDIDAPLLEAVEDVLLCRRPDAAERLAAMAQSIANQAEAAKANPSQALEHQPQGTLEQRISHAMIHGDTSAIGPLAQEALRQCGSPIEVINAMLMPAMEAVGSLFAQGKLFLPQVVKSARAMKQAVDVLTPAMAASQAVSASDGQKPKVVMATVKGDVHDIGKNIVSVVLACNGVEIIDLGVMVPAEAIIDAAISHGAMAIGLSGLITPSLQEMANVAAEAERRGCRVPIIIGGATTSALHTAVKIAPMTSAPVIHSTDAAANARIISALLSPEREQFLAENRTAQQRLRLAHQAKSASKSSEMPCFAPSGQRFEALPNAQIVEMPLVEAAKAIDWSFYFAAWGVPGKYPAVFDHPVRGEQARQLYADATALLQQISADNSLPLKGVQAAVPARADGPDLVLDLGSQGEWRVPMAEGWAEKISDGQATLFAYTSGLGVAALAEKYREAGDDYTAFSVKFLADRLVEAMAETLLPGRNRLAIGYPAIPNHALKRQAFDLLGAERLGLALTDTCMITPAETICGLKL